MWRGGESYRGTLTYDTIGQLWKGAPFPGARADARASMQRGGAPMSEPFIARTQAEDIVFKHIRRALPALGNRPISPDATIEQLGGHSLMAAEIAEAAMQELHLSVPARELAGAHTTRQLVDVFLRQR